MDYATMADAARQREEEQLEIAELKQDHAVVELMENKYLNLRGAGFWDLAVDAMDDLDKLHNTDEEHSLTQLVMAAYDSSDPLLRALAAPYYEILRRHAAKLAEEEVSNG